MDITTYRSYRHKSAHASRSRSGPDRHRDPRRGLDPVTHARCLGRSRDTSRAAEDITASRTPRSKVEFQRRPDGRAGRRRTSGRRGRRAGGRRSGRIRRRRRRTGPFQKGGPCVTSNWLFGTIAERPQTTHAVLDECTATLPDCREQVSHGSPIAVFHAAVGLIDRPWHNAKMAAISIHTPKRWRPGRLSPAALTAARTSGGSLAASRGHTPASTTTPRQANVPHPGDDGVRASSPAGHMARRTPASGGPLGCRAAIAVEGFGVEDVPRRLAQRRLLA